MANRKSFYGTRNSLTFENQLLLRMGQKSGRSLKILVYAITVVFANVRELRVTPSLGKVPLSYQSEMLEYIFPPLYFHFHRVFGIR